jgi:Flp pilus assembly protein TadG
MVKTIASRSKTSAHRRRTGGAMVEMALLLPLVVLLLFGIIEYGWTFMKASQVSNAARHGARVAARPAASQGEVEAAVLQMMTEAQLGSSGYAVLVSDLGVSVGAPVTVEITVNYNAVTLTGSGLVPLPSRLHAIASMSKEGPGGPGS